MTAVFDADEANTNEFNPLVPRAIDLPTLLGADGINDAAGDVVKIFAAPTNSSDWQAWREHLDQWRQSSRARLTYSGAAYDSDHSRWASKCYSVALVWLWDERLYDHTTGRFTVDHFLAGTAEYGGFDGIVLWHAYPVIGIDDRNQFDFYRDVASMAALVAEFQRHGLKVFINYNPWDTGTRRPSAEDPAELATLVSELRVDGVFLDTMKEGGTDLINALVAADPPQVLEGESRIQLSRIEDHHLSWAQWFADSEAPGVLRAHWYERRHMMHHTRRWNRDHSAELQSSFMNGTGMLIWDAVFGVWVGWNERDLATLRRMLRLQRAFTNVFLDGDWTPLVDAAPRALTARVYVSRFRTTSATLWTIINRADTDYHGSVLTSEMEFGPGVRLVDLGNGAVLSSSDDHVTVQARGLTAIVAVTGPDPVWLTDLLRTEKADVTAHSAPSAHFPARTAIRVSVSEMAMVDAAPARTVFVPAVERELRIRFRRRETGLYQGAPYVEEWKPLPPRLHDEREESVLMKLGPVAVATTEVTVAEFDCFVAATNYRPLIPNRFLGGRASTDMQEGRDSHPASLVSLADARAYAAWAGARLPTEFEWQVAAADPAFIRLHPLVWNWTESEHSDGITRFVMLKGGSSYQPTESDWYFDGGAREPEFTAKFLLPGQGLDRSTSIGFRVCWDVSAVSTS